jgi:hypothetical protein
VGDRWRSLDDEAGALQLGERTLSNVVTKTGVRTARTAEFDTPIVAAIVAPYQLD